MLAGTTKLLMIVWELIEASSGINSWQLAYHKRMDGAGAGAGVGAGAGAGAECATAVARSANGR